jgi:uncharacterized protein (DUF488 family)
LAEVFTIGHSGLEYDRFLALLRNAKITAIADVRSAPQSQHFPHFNRENLESELLKDGIAYVYLGDHLGGRPKNENFYCEGVADYEKMATDENFKKGINRVVQGSQRYQIAVMCSEQSPFDCHRCLLIGRALSTAGITVGHLLSNGRQLSQTDIENQLVQEYGRGAGDLFATESAQLANAYRERARRISYRKPVLRGKHIIAAE